jgi:uncharacterized membrane protein YsdA (DUF1294 family)
MLPEDALRLLAAMYIIINLIAFTLYGMDKRRAVMRKRRVPEAMLLTFSLFGAFGATAGMRAFRHKTRKPLFRMVYVFLALNVAVIAMFVADPML